MKQDDLVELISKVFPSEPYPDESSIVTNRETVEGTEEYEIAQAFRGKSWKGIDSDTVRYHSVALAFFTPEASRYFLPAYMTLCITNYEEVDHATTALIGALKLPEEDKITGLTRSRFLEITNEFTDEQKNAIAHFLEYISEVHGQDFPAHKPSIVLDLYWKRFKK